MELEHVTSKPEVRDLMRTAEALEKSALAIHVETATEYADAGEELKRIKGAMKRLEEVRFAITRPMDEAKKNVLALFEQPAGRLRAAENAIKAGLLAYCDKLEKEAEARRREAEEAARKERLRLEQEARAREEKARREAEAARAAAAAAREAGDAKAALKHESKAERVEENEAAKVAEIQEAVREIETAAPVLVAEVPKVKGIGSRETWDFEVVDLAKVPREYLKLDEVKVRRVVGALKGDTAIPGIRAFARRGIASRGS